MNTTLNYYNEHADIFVETTQNADMYPTQDRFLSLLSPGSRILDFGCGSGRDTRYFLDRGYEVEATDGSEEICKLASEFTGIPVKQMLFQEIEAVNKYDGIWACASILHLAGEELLPVLIQMKKALRDDGVIYTSFKYGTFEGERNGRYFKDFTEESFRRYLEAIPELYIEDYWLTDDVRPDRSDEKWLNLLLKKKTSITGIV